MPVINANVTNSPIHTTKISPTSTPTKQRAEKFIGVGGHYTPQADNDGANENIIDRKDTGAEKRRESASTFPSEIMSPSKSTAPIPQQRSLFLVPSSSTFTTTTASFSTTITRSQTKEQLETACTTFATSSTSANADINSHTSATRATIDQSNITTTSPIESQSSTCLTSYSALREQHTVDGMQEAYNKSGTSSATAVQQRAAMQSTATKSLMPTGAYPPLQQQQQFQLGSKNESDWTFSNGSEKRVAATSTVLDSEKKTGKISNKLQNNQFIKNQQTNSKVSTKYNRNVSQSDQENTLANLASESTNCTTTKKKMVAVQEMKKTTQNVSYHHHHHHQHHHRHQQQEIISSVSCEQQSPRMLHQTQRVETDFDSEDLSYGPGIVSKLRCRYLSLALRESMEKQRHSLENLRRATSLNNLLDRNDHKEEDEDDEENEHDIEQSGNTTESKKDSQQNCSIVQQKLGILKQANKDEQMQQEYSITKKTATFQTSIVNNGNEIIKPTGEVTSRSRHIKRGNDSLKRARSVEALLCERSPWNFAVNRSSLNSSATTTLDTVTIEDKISNARERLVLGVDSMPPKRLTSIIDDTERPPPDLVKQTLKKFEATANRRGRGPARTNGKGEVAIKVASYKSIIKENKPAIFPKPSLSPTKRLPPKPKTIVDKKESSNGGFRSDGESSPRIRTSTPLQKSENHMSELIPVLKSPNSTNAVKPKINTAARASNNARPAVVDSPVTSLMKRLEQLSIDSNSVNVKKDFTPTAGRKLPTAMESQQQYASVAPSSDEVVNFDDAATDDASSDVKAQRHTDSENELPGVVVGGDAPRAPTAAAEVPDKKNDHSERDDENVQTYDSASSDLSDDECGLTKRISKKTLENIAKAGTTHQFKFAENASTKSNLINSVQNQNTNLNSSQVNSDIAQSVLNVAPGKQIGVIRPLLTTPPITTTSTQSAASNSSSINPLLPDTIKHQQQQYFNYTHPIQLQTANIITTTTTAAASTNSFMSSSPLNATPPLTNREIEKNRINEMKKTASTDISDVDTSANASLLDTVITAGCTSSSISPSNSLASGFSELDAVTANNSPLWALRRKRQTPTPAAENTSMVFNFSNRKEVPDYIENDGVIFRRKRELPKPSESGFVLLGDISLETSTDTDYDDFSACPPSPCNVEFENANIVIDGKSSIRQKPKDATFRVQFDDSLTSTFEYPSEASMVVEDSVDGQHHHLHHLYGTSDDFLRAFDNLVLEDGDSPQHHHVAVDEIIQLPAQPNTASATTNAASPIETTTSPLTKNILGNLPLDVI